MNKRSLALLEKAFSAEIEAALTKGFEFIQTKSKLAEQLVEQGYLFKTRRVVGHHFAVVVEGYALTELGRMTYCFSCNEQP